MGETMRPAKYGHLTLIEVSSGKIILDIKFTDKTIVKRNIPVVKAIL